MTHTPQQNRDPQILLADPAKCTNTLVPLLDDRQPAMPFVGTLGACTEVRKSVDGPGLPGKYLVVRYAGLGDVDFDAAVVLSIHIAGTERRLASECLSDADREKLVSRLAEMEFHRKLILEPDEKKRRAMERNRPMEFFDAVARMFGAEIGGFYTLTGSLHILHEFPNRLARDCYDYITTSCDAKLVQCIVKNQQLAHRASIDNATSMASGKMGGIAKRDGAKKRKRKGKIQAAIAGASSLSDAASRLVDQKLSQSLAGARKMLARSGIRVTRKSL